METCRAAVAACCRLSPTVTPAASRKGATRNPPVLGRRGSAARLYMLVRWRTGMENGGQQGPVASGGKGVGEHGS
eukprot:scaffold8697_cov113-Isochrysis_galbana.AAC.1